MTPRRNDPRFGPDGPSTSPEPDRGAAGGPEGAAPRDGEDGPERADRDRLAREEAEDAEFDAAIKAIVSSGLIAGPDPGVVEEIRAGGGSRWRIATVRQHCWPRCRLRSPVRSAGYVTRSRPTWRGSSP